MEAGRWLCLKPKLLVAFCSGMVRFVILGLQTFCMALGVNRPFLSTQELEWWLLWQYHRQGDWFCGDLLGVIVLPTGRHPDYLQRQQAARTDCDTVSVLTVITAWWAPIFLSTRCGAHCFIHTETGLSGCQCWDTKLSWHLKGALWKALTSSCKCICSCNGCTCSMLYPSQQQAVGPS